MKKPDAGPSRATRYALFVILLGPLVTWSCSRNGDAERGGESRLSLVSRAQEFRSHLDGKDYEAARTLMAPVAHRWSGTREGDGEPWTIGSQSGPWSDWDEQLGSQKEVVRWTEAPGSATLVIRETNDYFRLLERGWVTNEVTYYFNDSGRIDGLLIRTLGERPPGRTEEFLAWAMKNDPAELEALMPGGEIDPSGDHPQRFRRLLQHWRRDVGLESIE